MPAHDDDRPNPDLLLRKVKAEETRARRGKLKIFFGFAPGVGKTYRMLQVARDLIIDQQLDIVVGLVETHKRMETAAMMLGLELLPRRSVPYRGQNLEEFDLDLALARKPRIVLLDELAHTNAPGSRHAKRWQDVQELLEAGIDVFTTVNVQHLESLNDVVAQITHVQVRETVPDSIIDGADEIEIVDIAPEELLQRLKEGRVYLPDQAARAAEHFFKRGNLLALREIALRRIAQHVDADVLEYREAHGVEGIWPTAERILVCVGAAPSSGRLIRAAARMAAGLRCPWTAAVVDAASLGRTGSEDRERLERHLRLAESLGAGIVRLGAGPVAPSLLAWARKNNVTRIVIGKPTHSRLRDRLRGSLLDEIVRGSGQIDVQVISGDADREAESTANGRDVDHTLRPYALAAAIVAGTTALAALIRAVYPIPDSEMLYLLAVMYAAFHWGRGPAVLAAGLGVAAYDFFFVPPFHTFSVSDVRYVLTFLMMFGVGVIISEMAERIRRQEQAAVGREERTSALYALTRELGGADAEAAARTLARHAASCFDAPAFVLRPTAEGVLGVAAASPEGAALDSKELGVARWVYEHGRTAGLGLETLPGARSVCSPLRVAEVVSGVVALVPPHAAPLKLEQRAFLDTFCRQAAFAFERIRLADEAHAAALRARAEEMRSSLLSAVSHDLRTPLAAITGAASALREEPASSALDAPARADLLDTIAEEAERLERLVSNLLDMTRLSTGQVALRKDWVPLDEMVGSALTRLEARLGERPATVEVAPELPLLSVDPVLFEQVFVNLFENAAKYTPEGTAIGVRAWTEGQTILIEVWDRGPGLPLGDEERVFDKFYRGPQRGVAGVGLGLPICRGIVEAHGGTIRAENRPAGGAVFRIALPVAPGAPGLPDEGAA